MIKPIVQDVFFLNQKSETATKEDLQVVQDLLDTLKANEEGCVGLAANMIGVKKRIIAIHMGLYNLPMINPVIIKTSGMYEVEEGCLSLKGERKTTRYKEIEVEYLDLDFKKHKRTYSGMIAQIIQHEVDHCNGIVI